MNVICAVASLPHSRSLGTNFFFFGKIIDFFLSAFLYFHVLSVAHINWFSFVSIIFLSCLSFAWKTKKGEFFWAKSKIVQLLRMLGIGDLKFNLRLGELIQIVMTQTTQVVNVQY